LVPLEPGELPELEEPPPPPESQPTSAAAVNKPTIAAFTILVEFIFFINRFSSSTTIVSRAEKNCEQARMEFTK
jgi:hypothetical protein